jgi:hypothetical protein
MNKIILASIAAASLALSAGAALAQTTGSVTNDTSFEGVDTDRNGLVSWPEFALVFTDVSEAQFNTADLDGDGLLSADEFSTITLETGSIPMQSPMAPAAPVAPQSLTYEAPVDN